MVATTPSTPSTFQDPNGFVYDWPARLEQILAKKAAKDAAKRAFAERHEIARKYGKRAGHAAKLARAAST